MRDEHPKDHLKLVSQEDHPDAPETHQVPVQLHLIDDEEKTVFSGEYEANITELPYTEESVKLRSQLALLKQEHQDLEDSINALLLMPVPDQILIMRLKRKKLSLKDRITEVEDMIRPDIIA